MIEWIIATIVDSIAAAFGSNLGYRFRRRRQAQILESSVLLPKGSTPPFISANRWQPGHLVPGQKDRASVIFRSGRLGKQSMSITFRDEDVGQLTELGGREVSPNENLWVNGRCRIYTAMSGADVVEIAILPEDLQILRDQIGA